MTIEPKSTRKFSTLNPLRPNAPIPIPAPIPAPTAIEKPLTPRPTTPSLEGPHPKVQSALAVLALLLGGADGLRAQSYPPTVDLGALDGSNGVTVRGTQVLGFVGAAVAGVGDINVDGFDDVLIGTGFNGESNAYVIYGASLWSSSIDLGALDGSNGVALLGGLLNNTGVSVAAAGDFNGDDLADLILGGDDSDPFSNDFGGAYLLVGGSDFADAAASVLLDTYVDGTTGVTLEGASPNGAAGSAVGGGGDINGDGRDDIIVGAFAATPNGPNSGVAHVLFGSEAFPPFFSFRSLQLGVGFSVAGALSQEEAGSSVAVVGDVNGDGFDDFLINGGSDPDGDATLVYGAAQFPEFLDLGNINGSNGIVLQGPPGPRLIGVSTTVSAAGDVNGDGFDDLLIGTMWIDELTGGAFVIYGGKDLPARLRFDQLSTEQGFAMPGDQTGDQAGSDVTTVGDLNQDGFDDVMIGARFASPQGTLSGTSYVVFGGDDLPALIEFAELDGSDGFALLGPSEGSTAGAVAGAGDVNADGVPDLLIGGANADVDGVIDAGEAYIVFGLAAGPTMVQTGSCPGMVTVELSGFTPDRGASGFKGDLGQSVIPRGPCAGVELEIRDVGSRLTIDIDVDGQGSAVIQAPSGSCGDFIQILDDTTCEASDAQPVGG